VEAEARAEARRAELDAERDTIDAADAERERQFEEAERVARQRAAREAAAKRSANRTTAAKRKQAVDQRAARTDAACLSSEAGALQAKERAIKARGEALEVDGAVQAKKSARRARFRLPWRPSARRSGRAAMSCRLPAGGRCARGPRSPLAAPSPRGEGRRGARARACRPTGRRRIARLRSYGPR